MKQQLEDFKKLFELFEKKAEQIALLKNKYRNNFNYDYVTIEYCDNEWYVKLVKRQRYEDDYECFYITEDEIVSDINDLEVKYKQEKEKKDAENERLKKEKEEKERIEKEKRDFALYEQLKNKFEK